ncbi:MAG: BamA/TamA family outer membrane protein [Terriglobia bacterium]|nr:BamA/TamA family outer membrane protein [Terriglobia bacterium]
MIRVRFPWFTLLFISSVLAVGQQAPTAVPETIPCPVENSTGKTTDCQRNQDNRQRGSFVVAPIPISSPALGTGINIMGGYIFSLSKKDRISPPSVLGGAAVFTNNSSRAFALAGELYFKEDRYHVIAGVAHGDLNYDFYGTGTSAGDAGRKFGLNETGTLFFGAVMRRLPGKIFVGPRIWMGASTLAPKEFGENHPDLPPLNLPFNLRAIGVQLERDTVPNRFYPVKGTSLKFSADFFANTLGSTFSFQSYQFTFNAYRSFDDRQVLAYNAFACSTGGEAPFFGQCIFGMRNELRGYPAGRYIDDKMLATQVEYRVVLPWRMGAVAFAGIGEVGSSLSKFNYDNLLPSGGVGLRFNLSKKYHVNLRADIAQGKNGHTFSMGLAEAF